MQYGLIGERLGHSFSKEIHARLFDYTYELREIAPEELDGFMRARDFKAINVTIPYKQDVIKYLDEIDTAAQKIGAVNTIVNRGGRLIGFNTDFSGLRALVLKSGVSVAGKKALVLGSGGTSKTALAVLEDLGAAECYRVSRSGRDGSITYEQAYEKHIDAEIIINTTPCGMFPKNGESAVEIERFSKLNACFDAVYNPLRSNLVLRAKKMGAVAEGGLYMLVAQAVFAAEHFKSETLPEGTIDRVYREILKAKQNLVLIGMPSSGKTTLGRLAAQDLGMKFVDTDKEIEKKTGRTPAEIITAEGEAAFRDIESDTVAAIAAQQGTVIATGGGAVLREENRLALAENGKILFLDRPVDKLLTTDNRPLSSSREKLEQRYRERYDIYCSTADKRIDCVDSKQDNVLKIKEAFLDEN